MDYIFVVTDPRVGNKVIRGPITGKDWLVTSHGSWIADEFPRDDRCLFLDIPRFCSRTQSVVNTKICMASPSWDQMEQMPDKGD